MTLSIPAGGRMTADILNLILPIRVDKTAPESVTSSTTLQADNELLYSLAAGRIFKVEAFLAVTGAAAGDIKVDWAVTGGVIAAKARSCRGPAAASTDASATTMRSTAGHALTAAVAYGTDGTNASAITEVFWVSTPTAGTLTMRWAQNASSGTATVVTADSWLLLTPIS